MNDHLTLPPERRLSEKRRSEMGAVLDQATRSASEPRRTRFAFAPALALAAVAAVAAVAASVTALVVGLTQAGEVAVPVLGAPTPSASTPSDGATVSSSAPIPPARQIDRGPLDTAAARKLAAGCDCDGPRHVVRQVLFARHTSTNGDVVLYTGGDGTTYARARNPTMSMGGPGGPVRPDPNRARPVVQWAGTLTTSDTGATYYRVAPEVASLQVRVVVDGHAGPWFEASMADGYAWAAASSEYAPKDADPGAAGKVRVEDRAFDAQGRALHIDHD